MNAPIRLVITVTAQQDNESNQYCEEARYTLDDLREVIEKFESTPSRDGDSSSFLHAQLQTLLNQSLEAFDERI